MRDWPYVVPQLNDRPPVETAVSPIDPFTHDM